MTVVRIPPDRVPTSVVKSLLSVNDPFVWPFTTRLSHGLVLYPTAGYHFSEKQFDALRVVSAGLGEEGFYVSVVEYEGDPLAHDQHWWFQWGSYQDYRDLPLTLENLQFSPLGTWASLFSHEDHALLGWARPEQLEAFEQEYGNPTDASDLLTAWRGQPEGAWVTRLLSTSPLACGEG